MFVSVLKRRHYAGRHFESIPVLILKGNILQMRIRTAIFSKCWHNGAISTRPYPDTKTSSLSTSRGSLQSTSGYKNWFAGRLLPTRRFLNKNSNIVVKKEHPRIYYTDKLIRIKNGVPRPLSGIP